MLHDATLTILLIVIVAILSIVSYKAHCLDSKGAVASFILGSATGILGSVEAFILLMIFTVSGFAATMKGLKKKIEKGLQEGQKGERGWKNVVGVGAPALAIIIINLFVEIDDAMFCIMYISTLAVAGADTIASEIGTKDPNVYMITNFKRVEPGINGGVSVLGTTVSTVASLVIAALGWIIMQNAIDVLLLIPFAMGVFGNLLDSVFGAVLENPGYISKYTNNASTGFIAAIIGGVIYLALVQ